MCYVYHHNIYEHRTLYSLGSLNKWKKKRRRHDNKQALVYSYIVKMVRLFSIVVLRYILSACNAHTFFLFLPQQAVYAA